MRWFYIVSAALSAAGIYAIVSRRAASGGRHERRRRKRLLEAIPMMLFDSPFGQLIYKHITGNRRASGVPHRRVNLATNAFERGPLRVVPVPFAEDNYAYLIVDVDRDEAVVVDPGDAASVLWTLTDMFPNAKLKAALLTHHHWDHVYGVKDLLKVNPSLLVYGSESDFPYFTMGFWRGVNRWVGDGEEVRVGRLEFKVISTPFHTMGHCMFLFDAAACLKSIGFHIDTEPDDPLRFGFPSTMEAWSSASSPAIPVVAPNVVKQAAEASRAWARADEDLLGESIEVVQREDLIVKDDWSEEDEPDWETSRRSSPAPPVPSLDGSMIFSRSNGSSSIPPSLFTGDALFVAGVGKFFEGDAEDLHSVIKRLTGLLAPETLLWPGHEYAFANLSFARELEPTNGHIQMQLKMAEERSILGMPAVPSIWSVQLETNPFLRVDARTRKGELWHRCVASVLENSPISAAPASPGRGKSSTGSSKRQRSAAAVNAFSSTRIFDGDVSTAVAIAGPRPDPQLITPSGLKRAEIEMLHALRWLKNGFSARTVVPSLF